MKMIPELVRGYMLMDGRNVDELGMLFYKLLPDKGLIGSLREES